MSQHPGQRDQHFLADWIESRDHFSIEASFKAPSPRPASSAVASPAHPPQQVSSGRAPTPAPALPAAAPDNSDLLSVEEHLNLLMAHYLGTLPKPQAAAFDQPKGLSALFVKCVCFPASWFDLNQVVRGVRSLLARIAFLVVWGSFIFVPAWLWLVRHCSLHHQHLIAVVTVLGAAFFLACDTIAQRTSKQAAADKGSIVTAATISTYLSQPVSQASAAPARVGRVGSSRGPASSTDRANAGSPAPGPPGSATAAPAARSAGTPAQGAPAAASEWAGVRKAVIALEYDVFGNELTEGVLPADVLPGRVRMLCEQVGLAYPEGSVTPQTLSDLLAQVQRTLGV